MQVEIASAPDNVRSRITLVHRLQRERGATCAWVAGGGNVEGRGVRLPLQCGSGSLVADLRRRTDRSTVTDEKMRVEISDLRKWADQGVMEPGERAKAFYSTLNGYSSLIEKLSAEALTGAPYTLKEVAKLKELYAQQRGFLVGCGSLEASALAALPPRALVYFLQLQEELLMTLGVVRLTVSRKGTTRTARERLERAVAIDDRRMADLSDWLRTDAFDLAALRARFDNGDSLPCDACWIVWTSHIDKLQALEDELLKEHYIAVATWSRLKVAANAVILAATAAAAVLLSLFIAGFVSDRTVIITVLCVGVGSGVFVLHGPSTRRVQKLSGATLPHETESISAGGSDSSFYAGSSSPSSSGIKSNPISRLPSDVLGAPAQATSDEDPGQLLARLRGALPEGAVARAMRPSSPSLASSSPSAPIATQPRMASSCATTSCESSSNHPASEIEDGIEALHARLGLAKTPLSSGPESPSVRSSTDGLQFNMSFMEGLGSPARLSSEEQQQPSKVEGHTSNMSSLGVSNADSPLVQRRTPGTSPNVARRSPHPLGLVAHQPPSSLHDRSAPEAIAAVFETSTSKRVPDDGTDASSPPKSLHATHCSGGSSNLSSSPRDERARSPRPHAMTDLETQAEMQALEGLMDTFELPNALDGFIEVKCLGRGAFGHALLMQSTATGQRVVAKRLQYDALSQNELRLLENEVKVCARLRHPNIAHYFGTVVNSDKVLICLEYAAGGTLADSIDRHFDRKQPYESSAAVLWIRQIAAAVSHMHSMRILHRDLSANNVFLSASGNIKVGDFGLSKANTQSRSAMGRTVCGTPNYFSPEMINGDPYGTPSDTWSVGLLAYEILTLEHPFSGGSLASMLKRIASSDYDKNQLERAPHPKELLRVASNHELLHPDPTQRLRLEELLARDIFKPPTPVAKSPS